MRILMKTKLFTLLTVLFIFTMFLFIGTATAFAGSGLTAGMETLSVDEIWLTGDMLHITVTDENSGESQTFELNLSDYAKPGDEYVTIKATDSSGRESNAIQFRNPYYVPQKNDMPDLVGDTSPLPDGSGQPSWNGPNPTGDGRPFTPEGTGTVVDNATDGDGKEFFTVETPDGNVFYLIVDRQRTSESVYLLNAVTEDDLASLAKPGNGKGTSSDETLVQPPETSATPDPVPAQPTEVAPEKSGSSNVGTIVFVVIAVVGVGGAGYYFKIVRPKQLGTDGADDYDDTEDGGEYDDDEELDVTEDSEGDDEE